MTLHRNCIQEFTPDLSVVFLLSKQKTSTVYKAM